MMTEDNQQPGVQDEAAQAEADSEFYVEPPRTTLRDTVEVLVAIVLLVIIGVAGYHWLTPRASTAVQTEASSAGTTADSHDHAAAPETEETMAHETTTAEARCEYCGMFADRSRSHIRAEWSDGSTSHHDSFDCLFNYGQDAGLTLASAEVAHYESDPDAPQWLDVTTAMYLYDTTEPVAGSMPPYVAAGSCTSCTGKLKPELGGTEMDWPELAAQWPEAAAAIGVTETN